MPFMQTQQVQPASHIAIMLSQQAWIILQQASSPLVQVMQTPFSVVSHLHIPIIMLQQHIIMPFIIMQHEHMPPAIIVQRFCIMLAVIASSLEQVIFIPPLHFSILIVHRGTIIICGAVAIAPAPAIGPPPMPGIPIPMPGIPIPIRSIIMALVISIAPRSCW